MEAQEYRTLQAVTHAIELKPGCKYLLIFKGDGLHRSDLDIVQDRLAAMGVSSLGVFLPEKVGFDIVEMVE